MGKRKWQGGKARSTGPSEAFSKQDLGSCKGHGVVLATCDAAKEREASKELCNVITDAVEQLYPEDVGDSSTNDADEDYEQELSMEEMIKREVEGLKHAPSSSSGNKKNFQKVVSIKTDVKGLVLLKLTSKNHCPLRIVKHIMDLVRSEKRAFTRYAVRLIPLQVVFYPNDVELKEGMNELLSRNIPELAILPLSTDAGVEGNGEGEVDDEHQSKRPKNDNSGIIADQIEKESVTIIQIDKVTTTISTTKPKFTYSVTFKARNNNSFSRDFILQLFNGKLREFGSVDYLNPQIQVTVEAFKNICGVSWIEDAEQYAGFNLRKFQQSHAPVVENSATSRVETVSHYRPQPNPIVTSENTNNDAAKDEEVDEADDNDDSDADNNEDA